MKPSLKNILTSAFVAGMFMYGRPVYAELPQHLKTQLNIQKGERTATLESAIQYSRWSNASEHLTTLLKQRRGSGSTDYFKMYSSLADFAVQKTKNLENAKLVFSDYLKHTENKIPAIMNIMGYMNSQAQKQLENAKNGTQQNKKVSLRNARKILKWMQPLYNGYKAEYQKQTKDDLMDNLGHLQNNNTHKAIRSSISELTFLEAQNGVVEAAKLRNSIRYADLSSKVKRVEQIDVLLKNQKNGLYRELVLSLLSKVNPEKTKKELKSLQYLFTEFETNQCYGHRKQWCDYLARAAKSTYNAATPENYNQASRNYQYAQGLFNLAASYSSGNSQKESHETNAAACEMKKRLANILMNYDVIDALKTEENREMLERVTNSRPAMKEMYENTRLTD